ncbi:MAG: long-chain-fatty-acid--CoA ligase [Woeseiaceae bacterium]|nr:long-chain-fatty-acid--CoA ligase [Woeseiaceae bacterium]
MLPNLGLFLTKRAQLNAAAEAIVEIERERRYTYAELNSRCNRVANLLLEKGIGKGDRVAFLMMNGIEYIESFFACAKIGAIVVPLNWRLVPDELEFIVNDSGSIALVFDSEFDESVAALHNRDTNISQWLRVGDADSSPDWAQDYESASSDSEPGIGASGDDRLFIMYTSGTTGLPKGAVHTHNTMIWSSLTVNMTCDMRLGDNYLQVMPLFHVGALTPAICVIHRGGNLIVMRAFEPHRVFDVIAAERCNTGLLVPAMLQMMWASPKRSDTDMSSVRWFLSGAAPVPVSVIEDYSGIGVEIHQVYGLTECGGPACVIGAADAVSKAGSAGPAFLHTEVRVIRGDGMDIEPGETGEVIVSGPHLMKEYWNRPEATAETLKDGWLHTGDLATIDTEGFVYIKDRKKDMIISGGENVFPAEIENTLSAHPAILECAVIGMPSEKWGEVPLAIVSLQPDKSATADEIIAFCDDKLARFKIPKAVEFSDDIPRNPSGKILKRILRERYLA